MLVCGVGKTKILMFWLVVVALLGVLAAVAVADTLILRMPTGSDRPGQSAPQEPPAIAPTFRWDAGDWSACQGATAAARYDDWGNCRGGTGAWQVGAWGACSAAAPCGGVGQRSRTLACVSTPESGTRQRAAECEWQPESGSRTRSFVCRDGQGRVVADALYLVGLYRFELSRRHGVERVVLPVSERLRQLRPVAHRTGLRVLLAAELPVRSGHDILDGRRLLRGTSDELSLRRRRGAVPLTRA